MTNPVHALLDAAGIPWREPRAALIDRYGVSLHPAYEWKVIEIPAAEPLVEGLLSPLSVQVMPMYSPRFPATSFSAEVWFVGDARANLRRTAEQLEGRLGPAQIEERNNTVECQWRFGSSLVRLMAWPPDLQDARDPHDNPSHEREYRLETACHLYIETGFRPSPTPQELAWLESFTPVDRIRIDHETPADSSFTSPAEQSELEFVREPAPEHGRLAGQLGLSADREALIFCHRQLYVVPLADVLGFHVDRTLPAKGGGGSSLSVECRSPDGDPDTKTLWIAAGDGADDLNALAARIAEATRKRLVLGEYGYDV